jgi:hypothetical protein
MTSQPQKSGGHPAFYVAGLAAVVLSPLGLLWFNASQELGRYHQAKVCDKSSERDISLQCRQVLELRVTGRVYWSDRNDPSRGGLEVKLPNGTSQSAFIKDSEPQKTLFQQKPHHVTVELWQSKIMAIKVGEGFAMTGDNPEYKASNAQGGFLGMMAIGIGIGAICAIYDFLSHVWNARKQTQSDIKD